MSFPRMAPYPQQGSITIGNGQEHRVPKGGSFIRVRSADQKFKILLDDDVELLAEQDDVFRLDQGDKFKSFTIINDSGFSLTFQLEVGDGSILSNKASIVNNVSVINASGTSLKTNFASTLKTPVKKTVINAAAAVEVVAANTNRIRGFIRNINPVNTIFLGDATAQLIPLAPSEEFKLDNFTGAVYAVNNSGVNVDLIISEQE